MRGILIHTHISSVDGVLHADDPSDPLATQWLDAVGITGKASKSLIKRCHGTPAEKACLDRKVSQGPSSY